MEAKKHSPLPWEYDDATQQIYDANGFSSVEIANAYAISKSYYQSCLPEADPKEWKHWAERDDGSRDIGDEEGDETAKFIVHAANNIERVTAERDALLEEMQDFVIDYKNGLGPDISRLEKAIASVEGGAK